MPTTISKTRNAATKGQSRLEWRARGVHVYGMHEGEFGTSETTRWTLLRVEFCRKLYGEWDPRVRFQMLGPRRPSYNKMVVHAHACTCARVHHMVYTCGVLWSRRSSSVGTMRGSVP